MIDHNARPKKREGRGFPLSPSLLHTVPSLATPPQPDVPPYYNVTYVLPGQTESGKLNPSTKSEVKLFCYLKIQFLDWILWFYMNFVFNPTKILQYPIF
jgi:hypothetical protein